MDTCINLLSQEIRGVVVATSRVLEFLIVLTIFSVWTHHKVMHRVRRSVLRLGRNWVVMILLWRRVHPLVRGRGHRTFVRFFRVVDIKVCNFLTHNILIFITWHGIFTGPYNSIGLNNLDFGVIHFLFAFLFWLLLVKRSELILSHPLRFLWLRIIKNNMNSVHRSCLTGLLSHFRRRDSNGTRVHFYDLLFFFW